MTYQLEQYQEDFIRQIGISSTKNKAIIAQLATGGGKTVCFATIAYRFLQKTKKDVIIFCDSEKILEQTRKTLINWYQIDSDVIDASSAHIKRNTLFGTPRVFVAMVETFDRRAGRQTFINQLDEVGLVIVDECHIGNFIKIFDYFLFSLRIGFTATPISSDKKKPLNKYYQDIVIGPSIQYLIDEVNANNPLRGVVRDATYSLSKNINRKEIEEEQTRRGYKGDEFDAELTGEKLSGKKQIDNTIDAYVKHAAGKKMLCFNANVKHSILVTEAMNKYGLNARHIDANSPKEYKKQCFDWLRETKNAILCNVGIATKGFDEPSVEGVILNRLTKSPALYNQMCGRSARPYRYPDGRYKEYHIILDMCDNVLGGGHGQWSDFVDWKYLFENPKMPKQGVAPCKECPECGYICPASARKCKGMIEDFFMQDGSMIECGYEFDVKDQGYDEVERELILISKNIDVDKIVNFPKFQGKREFYTYYQTIRACAYYTREDIKYDILSEDDFESIWNMTYGKIVEWQRIAGKQSESGRKKRDTQWYTTNGRETLRQYLIEYGFTLEEVKKESDHHLTMQET